MPLDPKFDWRGLGLGVAAYIIGMLVVLAVIFLDAPTWLGFFFVPCWLAAGVGAWMHHRAFVRSMAVRGRSMHPPPASYRPPPGGHATDRTIR